MRVLIITQDFPPELGGIQTYCLEIAKRLDKLTSFTAVLAPDKPKAADHDEHIGVKVLRIKTSNTLLGWNGRKHIIDIIAKYEIDTLYHAQWQTLPIAKKALKKYPNIKVVCAVHGRELFFNPLGYNRLSNKLYSTYMKSQLDSAHLFLPVSHYTATELQKIFPKANLAVVNNGTNPEKFIPCEDRAALRNSMGLSPTKIIILTVTRLFIRKGVDTVIEALPEVVRQFPDLEYWVIGEGEAKDQILEKARQFGVENKIKLWGKIPYDDMVQYYQASDMYVMPSKLTKPDVEGFGIVFLEASATGLPVIGARSGGIPDAIIEGETGLLVPEKDPKALSEAILSMLNDKELRIEMSIKGRIHAKSEGNWDVITRQILDLFKKLHDVR